MDEFYVDIHHCGHFVDQSMTTYEGEVSNWKCDADRWSYFEIVDIVKKMGYPEVVSIWYKVNGVMKWLQNDKGAMEMVSWAKSNGKVQMYLVHPVSQPEEVVPLCDGVVSEDQNVGEAQSGGEAQVVGEAQSVGEAEVEGEAQSGGEAEVDGEAQVVGEAQVEDEAQTDFEAQVGSESEDSALNVRFGDSDDEVDMNDGFDDVQQEGAGKGDEQGGVDVQTVKRSRKRKHTKKKKASTSKKKKTSTSKKRGRPKKTIQDDNTDPMNLEEYVSSDPDSLTVENRSNKKGTIDRGLSDEDYNTEELETDESQNSSDEEGSKDRFPAFVMPKKMDDFKWVLGSLFSTSQEFKDAITTYAIHNGRDLRFIKNDKTRVRVGCKEGCDWVALCVKLPDEETWQLRKLYDTHTCNREYRVKFMSSSWLGKKLFSTVRENPKIKLTDICSKAHEKWNTGVSRMKAYRARRSAIDLVDGSFKEQYRRLYDYCHEVIRSNPNSTVKLTVQATEILENIVEEEYVQRPLLPTFQRLYMCLDGCRQSFLKCRPIIGLDGCFLKGYYGGQILAAVGRDPNDQMLPIALAVVEGETRDSWSWFLQLLVNDLGGQQACKSYTFMSDQQKGLLPAMDELLPGVEQRFCVRHLYNNFRKKHPGKMLKDMMWKAAKSSYPQAWERQMREMRKVNEQACKDLMNIPLRYWSKSRFTFNSKCDVLVNNMSETFNSVILGPRQKPIVTMLEEIRGYLMDRWAANRKKIETYNGSVLPKIKKRLEKEHEMSRFWLCRFAGDQIFEVGYINQVGEKFMVNLVRKECSCRRWMLTGIPCCHVVTCCNSLNQDPEELIPAYYRREAYEACYQPIIYPTNGQNLWPETPYPDMLPPPLRRPPGRPRRSRKKDADEKTKDSTLVSRKGLPNRCSKCKQSGHNKASCKGPSQAGSLQAASSQPAPYEHAPSQPTGPSQPVPSQPAAPSQPTESQPLPSQQLPSQPTQSQPLASQKSASASQKTASASHKSVASQKKTASQKASASQKSAAQKAPSSNTFWPKLTTRRTAS